MKEINNIDDIISIKTLNSDEKETHINIDFNNDICELYTTDNQYLTKMKRLIKKNPEEYKCYINTTNNGDITSYIFKFPKKYVRFGTKTKKVSDEQKKAAGERFKKMWKNKLND